MTCQNVQIIKLPSIPSQKQEKIYYDSEWKVCKEENAKYYRVYGTYDNLSNSWPIKSYYKNGTIQFIGNVQNNSHEAINCRTAKCNDQAIFYNEKGLKTSIYFYKNGVLHGPSSYFYENGKLKMWGTAKTPYEKDILWDKIKAIGGEKPSDIMADIEVADKKKQTR